MKNLSKDFEILSAYIDDELSEKERKEIEEKISLSKELQNKLTELKKIKKLTSSSLKNIEEDSFFETRLMANINSVETFKYKFRKWIPAVSFTVLSIALMLVLKFNPTLIDDVLKDQQSNITSFYADNLKPLLLTAGLTHEDIFNFAFSRQLPLDKDKEQYLQLDTNPGGTNSFEIKTAGFSNEDNFGKFVKALKLNTEQKVQMDSILDSYRDDLQSQVLVNNKNTIAISPNIWNYHKALFADLMSFAKDANQKEFEKIVPAGYTFYNKNAIVKMVKEIKSKPDSGYIFFTPDSIFTSHFKFDKDKFKAEFDKMQKDLKSNLKDLDKNIKDFKVNIEIDSNFAKLKKDSSWDKNFKVYIDSNICKVEIPKINIPQFTMPDFDSIAANIDKSLEHMKSFSFTIPKFGDKGNFNFKFDNGDSVKSFNFKIPHIDSLIKHNTFNDTLLINGKKFHVWGDSSEAVYKIFKNDSTIIWNQKEFKQQMKQMQKEMEKFKEQMQNFHKQFQQENKGKQIKEINSIEI